MQWQEKAFQQFRLYAVTDLGRTEARAVQQIEAVLRGGVRAVQLRTKVMPDGAFMRLGRKVRAVTRRYRALLFINDRLDLADLLDADGVHVGVVDMPVSLVRSFFAQRNKHVFIGASATSVAEACRAERAGADYIGAGPVCATPLKRERPAIGVKRLAAIARSVTIPVVAIGGINRNTINNVLEAGIFRVAVIRALFASAAPQRAAEELQRMIYRYERKKTINTD